MSSMFNVEGHHINICVLELGIVLEGCMAKETTAKT